MQTPWPRDSTSRIKPNIFTHTHKSMQKRVQRTPSPSAKAKDGNVLSIRQEGGQEQNDPRTPSRWAEPDVLGSTSVPRWRENQAAGHSINFIKCGLYKGRFLKNYLKRKQQTTEKRSLHQEGLVYREERSGWHADSGGSGAREGAAQRARTAAGAAPHQVKPACRNGAST